MGAQDFNVIAENLGEGFVDDSGLVIGGQGDISVKVLALFVVLGADVFVLLVIDGSVLFFEEDFVLNNEDVLNNKLVFVLAILAFSLNHTEIIQNDLAEIVCVFILEQLDLSMNQCKQVIIIQIE